MPQYSLVNHKLLSVKLNGDEVMSKRGAMIATVGKITFARSFLGPGGIGSAVARSVTGEGLDLMTATGAGEVLYGHRGLDVTVAELNNETMSIEGSSLLAFDSRLRASVVFQGNQGGVGGIVRGAISGQGLFTTNLTGSGQVAFLTAGDAIGLQVRPDRPIFADPQAYVGHKGNLTSQLVTALSWKSFLGQGSGEGFQLKFTGTGTVYIQASER